MKIPPYDEIAAAFSRYHRFYITTHVGPDGDAIGSALALRQALIDNGKSACYVCRDGVPASCRYLPGVENVLLQAPADFEADCAIVLDCDGSPERVASPYEPIAAASFKVLIDHHRTSVPTFDVNWIDPDQPATAMMVYRLLRHLQWEISPEIAAGLLCGLSTDTGHFRYASTSPETLRAAGDLVECGASVAETAFRLFDERSFSATQLLGLALRQMKSKSDGALIYTALATKDFQSLGSGEESSENVVNYLRNVKGCRMAFIFREKRDEAGPLAHISLRAEPELRADLFCNEFGGGGHAAAAGFRLRGRFEDTVRLVITRAQEWLEEQHHLPAYRPSEEGVRPLVS
jgi:phosphoesterase RecJ-like protein